MIQTQTTTCETCKTRPVYQTEETADAYEVRVYMPGVNKEGTTISLENEELSISGKRAEAPEGWRPLERESGAGDYELRLALNVQIEGDKIAARTENGVLYLKLPKAEAVKPRTISIQ
jgi:HSP20 family protein